MKTGIRLTFHNGVWLATESEPQGKDTYVRYLGGFDTKEEALKMFPNAEVYDGQGFVRPDLLGRDVVAG